MPFNISVVAMDYSVPTLVGANITLNCDKPSESDITKLVITCMSNGLWEPDPREILCLSTGAIQYTIRKKLQRSVM